MGIQTGNPYPLGAVYDGEGTNFAVFTHIAERVEVCLFDENGEETRLELPGQTDACRHGYVKGAVPGQRYGFRVHGPWAPEKGQLCLPSKLLLDPCARAVDGTVEWNDTLFPCRPARPDAPLNDEDSAPYMPRAIVMENGFDWEDDTHPDIPLADSIIYETHLKGFTARHPDIPDHLRGSYAGFAHEAVIEYLRKMGITAVELLPVFQFTHRRGLVKRGLSNYWGYDPIGFFAPHNAYASDGDGGTAVREFRGMVKALHRAGIEVILDVVYNHTAEGNAHGPMLSLKALDNPYCYRLDPDNMLRYIDYTGTDNTLNAQEPMVVEMILQSLRYWVEEMHVDGFRFDLTPILMRSNGKLDPEAPFLQRLHDDPVLRRCKWIAEPWDLGPGGYRAGKFPAGWSEWNGRYRDAVRDYWRGQGTGLRGLACRMQGSPDMFRNRGRRPTASVNFVTCHDGFTLRDLVTYERKHNRANREGNRDGTDDNRAWNGGKEGETLNERIRQIRFRQKRNLLATLLLSRGVPMLLGGDEIGRTQSGNNNAYCQDNRISWYDWSDTDDDLQAFTARLIRIRKDVQQFRQTDWPDGSRTSRIRWFAPSGDPLDPDNGEDSKPAPVGALFEGADSDDVQACLLLNPSSRTVTFELPGMDSETEWMLQLDTARTADDCGERMEPRAGGISVAAHALQLYLEAR